MTRLLVIIGSIVAAVLGVWAWIVRSRSASRAAFRAQSQALERRADLAAERTAVAMYEAGQASKKLEEAKVKYLQAVDSVRKLDAKGVVERWGRQQ